MAQNIITAPQIEVTPTIEAEWAAMFPNYTGTFAQFMTTPSADRLRWLRSRSSELTFDGPFCIPTYS